MKHRATAMIATRWRLLVGGVALMAAPRRMAAIAEPRLAGAAHDGVVAAALASNCTGIHFGAVDGGCGAEIKVELLICERGDECASEGPKVSGGWKTMGLLKSYERSVCFETEE